MLTRLKSPLNQVWFCLLLITGVTYFLYRPLRFYASYPDIDQSVFLYGGWRLSLGEMPYIAFWDHKGPLIYLLNSLPFVLGTGTIEASLNSIVWFEMLGMVVALSSLFLLLRAHFGAWAGFVGICSLIAVFRWAVGTGNYVEEWAFFSNSLILALAFAPSFVHQVMQPTRESALLTWARGAAIGALLACTLLLRPNEAGVGVAVVAFWLFYFKFRQGALPLYLGLLLGLTVPLTICIYWLARGGALHDFWDQYIVFNQLYSDATLNDRFASVIQGIKRFGARGTFVVALCGFILLLKYRLDLRRGTLETRMAPGTHLFLTFAALLFPLQIALSCLSGRAYPHYYMAWWLPCAIFCAYAVCEVRSRKENSRVATIGLGWRQSFAAILIFFAVTELGKSAFSSLRARESPDPEVTSFITSRTKPEESIVVWGNKVALHLHTERRGASRFIYQSAITETEGTPPRYLDQFLRDVTTAQPSVVIDTTIRTQSGDSDEDDEPSPGIRDFPDLRGWLEANYRLAGQGGEGWLLYERKK